MSSNPAGSLSPDLKTPEKSRFHVGRELAAILKMAAPLITINITVTLMQFIDSKMVAHLGEEALAAVMPAGFVYWVVLAFGWGGLSAVNTFVSQSLGKKDNRGCGFYTFNAMLLAVLYVVAAMPLSFLVSRPFWVWMGHEPQVFDFELIYFRVSLLGMIPNLILIVVSNFFTGLHKTVYLPFSAIFGSILNVIFNYLLIFGIWIFPEMGVAGSALGTVLATTCQMGLLLFWYWSRKTRSEYGTWIWQPSLKACRQILKIGGPGAFQGIFDLVTWGIILTYYIGQFGTEALAANTIIVRFMHISFMPALGMAIAATAFVGKSIGIGDLERANKQALLVWTVVMVYMCCVGLLFILFRDSMIAYFSDDPGVLKIGRVMFLFAGCFQLFDSMFLTFSHALR